MKRKKLFITFTAIFTVVVALAIFFTIWYWGDNYPDFNDKIFREEVAIPGLEDGATPQGITTYKADYKKEDGATSVKQDYFLISAYMKDGPSRIYVTGKTSGYMGYVTLKNIDGSDYTGHCGGVATNGRFLWVSSDDTVFVAKTTDSTYSNIFNEIITKAQNSKDIEGGHDISITFTTSFRANCNASFLYYYDADGGSSTTVSSSDRLYVGEFYRAGNYETDESRYIENPDTTINRAFAYEYNVNSNSTADNTTGLTCISSGISADSGDVPKVQKIFSIPNEIQGFARTTDNKMVLSQSYGLKNSKLYYYDWNKITATTNRKTYKSIKEKPFYYDGVKTTSGAPASDENIESHGSLYVYYVYGDIKNEESPYVRGYDIPSMSEGLCVADGRVHVLFESACNKYKLFVRQQISSVYSFIPSQR